MRRAVAFLTPFGGAAAPSPAALVWFPVVGAGLGLVLGGLWEVGWRVWPPMVVAAVVVAADLALTGMLHLDGLADAADGLLAPMDRARRLEVMADPSTGAFGVGTVAAVVLLRWAALAAMAPSVLLLAALWCASRTVMATTVRLVPYARPSGGLATAFLGGSWSLPAAVGALVAAMAMAAAGAGVAGVAAVAGGVVAAAGVVGLARRRLGGFTG
ncbi:MAG: adenosylcobinamide-GDP ribazoletransferase, partial [Actinomycetota bacterium]|nr:adenosylcobinamide-GDP ribazoletransferase [Actinomycetota bacterium]